VAKASPDAKLNIKVPAKIIDCRKFVDDENFENLCNEALSIMRRDLFAWNQTPQIEALRTESAADLARIERNEEEARARGMRLRPLKVLK
jgi:hypothetical protein